MSKRNRKHSFKVFKAKETINHFTEFENLTRMTQKELKKHLEKTLIKDYGYTNLVNNDGYLFAKGTYPVLICAHMDTVHKEIPRVFKYKENSNVLSSPQGIGGDDRCGIYMVLEVAKEINCSVLFLEDEEIGCVGADKFAYDYEKEIIKPFDINYIVEFDRRGSNDAVYYDLDNKEFENFITESSGGHFKTALGSCSDISILAPSINVAAVNLSCGYYNEHRLHESVVISEMKTNIEKAKEIIKTEVDKPFEWIEYEYLTKWKNQYGYGGYSSKGGNFLDDYEYYKTSSNGWYDYDEDDFGYTNNSFNVWEVCFEDDNGNTCVNYIEARSEEEAIGGTCIVFSSLSYNMVYFSDKVKEIEPVLSVDRYYIEGELVDRKGVEKYLNKGA